MLTAFLPQGNTTVIAVTTTASTGQQPSDGNIQGVLITNIGTVTAFVAFGGSDVSAAIPTTSTPGSGFPILPNTAQTFSVRPDFYVSAVTSAGTCSLYATPGAGV
jgi:hypothetical protein